MFDWKGLKTYAMASPAGTPYTGRLMRDRSVRGIRLVLIIISRLEISHSINILKANPPVKTSPRSSKTKPTRNWLSFPTTGWNGLA